MPEPYDRLFDYNAWANHRLRTAIAGAPDMDLEKQRVFQHVLRVEPAWLARLRGSPPDRDQPSWDTVAPEPWEALIDETLAGYQDFLGGLAADGQAGTIAYGRPGGVATVSRVEDVLLHVLLHSMHHRGDVQSALGDLGADPPDGGYMQYFRDGPGRA